MPNNVEDFLSTSEEQEIVEAIRVAELNTSGEIRVHIEQTCKGDGITTRALDLFHTLKMDNTKLQNGVLIYVAIDDKAFAIYGDKGINDKVESTFWDSTKNVMQMHFKQGDFKKGLIEGILKSGEELKRYFPYSDTDTNELTNEISKG
ncbi:TPM domain-containing protein [Algibacter pectinivorans]|uniref:TLP18.3, Psb32 and MOLO-1 founding protein of phosphatase n=1 Tax=Algibacter pectinivorans TaxID=870482 RepID=A0A1I1PUA4_9FLAO|nr:TPM domain-containing protein [Algibacter pectinivorans]SFD13267.1 TLP18.3, Psb32 and MOLO-1 founding protein of phosphatase [Algibacter pectinivorans]